MTAHRRRRRPASGRRHTFADLYHERTHFQFIDRSWRWALLSGTLILISVARVRRQRPQPRHRLRGRHAVAVHGERTGRRRSNDVRDVVEAARPRRREGAHRRQRSASGCSRRTSTHGRAGEGHRRRWRSTASIDAATGAASRTSGRPGATRSAARRSRRSIVFFVVIALYLTFRFEWRMALAAIIAVIHDIIITVGVYAITGFEVTPGDRRGVPHHPRVLALRHRRRVRQGEGERGPPRHRARRHVLGDGEPVAEPGADALDQHVVRGAAPGGVAARSSARYDPRRRSRCATSRSRCSSACSPARTRRSSSPRRSSRGSRSASRATARCASARPPTSPRPQVVAPVPRRSAPGARRPTSPVDGEDIDRRRRRRRPTTAPTAPTPAPTRARRRRRRRAAAAVAPPAGTAAPSRRRGQPAPVASSGGEKRR